MSAAENPHRLGPRPLPLHLATAYMTWTSSCAGLPLLKSGLPFLRAGEARPQRPKSESPANFQQLLNEIEAHDLSDFTQSLTQEVRGRLSAFLAGIETYRAHPYRRALTDPPICWEEGSTRLLDFGTLQTGSRDTARAGKKETAILVVPSLVNRSYVLDLTEQSSLMRWLSSQGFRPYLLDWGAPNEIEESFSLTNYIAGYLDRALDHVLTQTGGRPPVLMGYCMGGLLALALAQRREKDLAGLALLATPWNFHTAGSGVSIDQMAMVNSSYLPLASQLGHLPVDALQSLFTILEPMVVPRKFVTFSRLDPAGFAAQKFVAVEDWINDGVPLAAPVARECLEGWYQQNRPGTNTWQIAGKTVVPEELELPCLAAVPTQDRIVPPDSALALCTALKKVEILRPSSGHIGMIVGQQAVDELWRPLACWMTALRH
ncbi:alpha/beta fold hydrolase [Pelagibius sp. Alg239-R121]|uniref:alpha/beta fold hydrolase n=1 Tax=Pelagibius sp. Alg239-R121 TaxID=2993448 RepID=UPI0024A656D1|nr:alpha/beta fold hydrolase [Pelagibius sp. Alg239-R121]